MPCRLHPCRREAGRRLSSSRNGKESLSEDTAAITAMQKRGLQVHPVSPEMQREWDKFAADVLWPKIRGPIVGADSSIRCDASSLNTATSQVTANDRHHRPASPTRPSERQPGS